MATASIESGDITIWDLHRGGKLVGVVPGAHETSSLGKGTGLNKVEFLPGQPVLVSSELDNALRSWVFDQNPFSPIPRLLHSRSGHAASIMKLKFLPAAFVCCTMVGYYDRKGKNQIFHHTSTN
jgi:U3 small nucleolar RNA-associated protein 21